MRYTLFILLSIFLLTSPHNAKAGSCLTVNDRSLFIKAMDASYIFEGRMIEQTVISTRREINGKEVVFPQTTAQFDVVTWYKHQDVNKVSVILQGGGALMPGSKYPYKVGNNYLVFVKKLSTPYISEDEEYSYINYNCQGDGAILLEEALSFLDRIQLFFGSLF